MKILQVCYKPPYPPAEGGTIAMYNLARGWMDIGNEVHILAMSTPKHSCRPEDVPEGFRDAVRYRLVNVDTRTTPVNALLNLFTRASYHITRFRSEGFAYALQECLQQEVYHAVVLESIYTTPYLPLVRRFHHGPLVLRSHNMEHRIWQNLSTNEKNPAKRVYLSLQAKRLRRYETKVLQQADAIAAISTGDLPLLKLYAGKTPVVPVPFGIPLQDEAFREFTPPTGAVLFHVGSMDWAPHQEGFRWLLEKVWPEFHRLHPHMPLHLAGRGMPAWLREGRYPQVIIKNGAVDGKAFMKDKSFMLAPSFSGSGVSVKIIEGMAAGKVILTTSNGARGIACTHGKNILLADTPEAWIELLHQYIAQPEALRKIAGGAYALARQEFGHCAAAYRLETLIRSCIQA